MIWPNGEPRIFACVTEISKPFNAGQHVEIRLSHSEAGCRGECRWIVPAAEATHYRIGQSYAAHWKKV